MLYGSIYCCRYLILNILVCLLCLIKVLPAYLASYKVKHLSASLDRLLRAKTSVHCLAKAAIDPHLRIKQTSCGTQKSIIHFLCNKSIALLLCFYTYSLSALNIFARLFCSNCCLSDSKKSIQSWWLFSEKSHRNTALSLCPPDFTVLEFCMHALDLTVYATELTVFACMRFYKLSSLPILRACLFCKPVSLLRACHINCVNCNCNSNFFCSNCQKHIISNKVKVNSIKVIYIIL